jgi:hypothetical protein
MHLSIKNIFFWDRKQLDLRIKNKGTKHLS